MCFVIREAIYVNMQCKLFVLSEVADHIINLGTRHFSGNVG